MTYLNQTADYPRCAKRRMLPCETPGCSENCAYAYSCHEQRMGRSPVAFWPIIGLGLIMVMGIFA